MCWLLTNIEKKPLSLGVTVPSVQQAHLNLLTALLDAHIFQFSAEKSGLGFSYSSLNMEAVELYRVFLTEMTLPRKTA